MKMRKYPCRHMASIHLPIDDITGVGLITMRHNDRLGLKLVY